MSSDPKDNQVTHIRRCHVCGTVNESEGMAIRKCSDCGKHLAPFYYFDESKLEGISVSGRHFSIWKNTDNVNPIWGLSTYWQESNESHSRGHT